MNAAAACRLFALAALVSAAGAIRAAAQEPDRLARAREALPAPAAARLDRILRDATASGLPTMPLVDKTLEGEAKLVPPDRILAVVAQLAAQLATARNLLQDGAPPSPTDIAAVADALRRGVPEQTVRAFRAHAPGQPLALAIETLADLVQQGVPAQNALAVLEAWADHGARVSALRELAATIERMKREGTLPAEAAQTLAQMLGGSAYGRPASPGKSELAPGHTGTTGRPPLPPGKNVPPGRNKGAGPPSSRPGHG